MSKNAALQIHKRLRAVFLGMLAFFWLTEILKYTILLV